MCTYKLFIYSKSISLCLNEGKRQRNFSESCSQVTALSWQQIKLTPVIALQTSIPAEHEVGAEGRADHAVAAGVMEGAGVVVELGVAERVELAAEHVAVVAVVLKAARGPKVVRGVGAVVAATGRA